MNRNITALILLILAIGIYFTLTSGFFTNDQAIKAVNDQYASAIANAALLVAARDNVLKQYNNIAATDRDRLDKMLPSSVDNIRLVIDLNNIAFRHGFSLSGIKAVAGKSSSGASNSVSSALGAVGPASSAAPVLDTVTVSFGLNATYDQFISFLQDLEADLRVVDLTSLSMSASDTGVYAYQVQFQTYWLHQ